MTRFSQPTHRKRERHHQRATVHQRDVYTADVLPYPLRFRLPTVLDQTGELAAQHPALGEGVRARRRRPGLACFAGTASHLHVLPAMPGLQRRGACMMQARGSLPPGGRILQLTVPSPCSVGWIGALVPTWRWASPLSPPGRAGGARCMDSAFMSPAGGHRAVGYRRRAADRPRHVVGTRPLCSCFRALLGSLISLALTILCTGPAWGCHISTVSAMASCANCGLSRLRALGGDLFHPVSGLLVLLAITVLTV